MKEEEFFRLLLSLIFVPFYVVGIQIAVASTTTFIMKYIYIIRIIQKKSK